MMEYRASNESEHGRKPCAETPHAMPLLSRRIDVMLRVLAPRILKASAVLLGVALTACQQAVSTKSARAPGEVAIQPASASRTFQPDHARVLEELSVRSRIPTPDLRVYLGDCAATQLSMNICALRNLVAADLELEARREAAPAECRAELDRAHAVWEAERDKACREETEVDRGGSMYPMLLSSCKAEATKARILSMREMDSCHGER